MISALSISFCQTNSWSTGFRCPDHMCSGLSWLSRRHLPAAWIPQSYQQRHILSLHTHSCSLKEDTHLLFLICKYKRPILQSQVHLDDDQKLQLGCSRPSHQHHLLRSWSDSSTGRICWVLGLQSCRVLQHSSIVNSTSRWLVITRTPEELVQRDDHRPRLSFASQQLIMVNLVDLF